MSMSEWTPLRLADAITVKHGFAFPGSGFGVSSSEPQVLTPANFALSGEFQEAKPKSFSGPYPAEFLLSSEDVVITMTDLSKGGDTLGFATQLPPGRSYLHNQRIGRVHFTNPDLLDPRYFQYLTRTVGYRSHILGTASGSTVRHTSPSRIGNYVARVPSLRYQRAIGEVLGALDDKIAANMALARIATQLASSEFTQFARRIEPGPTFDQIATVSGGGTPSTANADFWEGGVSWATPTDMTALAGPYLGATSRSISEAGLAACSSKLFEPGAILMTSRATIGAIAVSTIPTAVNQGFIVVEPHDERLRWWLFHEMESRVEEFISWANGATFLELSRGNFKRLPVRVPADNVVDSFAARVSALHDRARAALEENGTLAATRDALLPQLMSGKLRVRDAEAVAADAGA